MAQFTDKDYYAGFFGNVTPYSASLNYAIGEYVNYLGIQFLSLAVNGPSTTVTTPGTDDAVWEQQDVSLGSGQFVSLEEIINNYMVGYMDEMNHGSSNIRYKVEFFAQRAIQEFSYDLFTVKSQEFQPHSADIPLFPMPQDFVNLVKISWVDYKGQERPMAPRSNSGNPTSPLQRGTDVSMWSDQLTYSTGDQVLFQGILWTSNIDGNNGAVPGSSPNWQNGGQASDYIFDSSGDLIKAAESVTQQRWRDRNEFTPYPVAGAYSTFEGGYNVFGRRYYIDPETANRNGTYHINESQGTISFDYQNVVDFDSSGILSIYYVSDGLGDPAEVKVHKFAENAIYESIYAELVDKRRDVPANEKIKARRRASALRRNAKLRLSENNHRELIQTLRNQSRWVKT